MADAGTALRIWIQKLKASDPTTREISVKALETLGDTDALPALAEVFATDPDPAVRGLARNTGKAIYYGAIRQKLEKQGASPEERRQAAEILARARAKRAQDRRKK